MHRWFLQSDLFFSFQIKRKQLLEYLCVLRCYLDCDSVKFWAHCWFATWSLWNWLQPLPLKRLLPRLFHLLEGGYPIGLIRPEFPGYYFSRPGSQDTPPPRVPDGSQILSSQIFRQSRSQNRPRQKNQIQNPSERKDGFLKSLYVNL